MRNYNHVYPVNDVRSHELKWPQGPRCWCNPIIDDIDSMVIHKQYGDASNDNYKPH